MDRLADLAASIERDPAQVARETREIADRSRATEDWISLSRAQAVQGRALRMLGEIELAETVLAEAVVAAQKSGQDELEANAHLALSSVLSIGGRSDEAFAHLDAVERLGSYELRGAAQLQRAVLWRTTGRIQEALQLFEQVIPRLRRESKWLDLARVLANRGIIWIGRGDVAAAIADYEEAEQLFRSEGNEFAAVQAKHNLGFAVANLGDLPRAVLIFDEVSTRFVELGHDASVPLLSRAEALLLGGMSAEALSFSQDAARRLQAEGNGLAAAQAWVAVAEAARLEGDFATAVDASERAQQWFASDKCIGWERAAALEMMRARQESDGLERADIERLEALADAFSDDGDVRGEIHGRCLAAVAACACGELDRAANQVAAARAAVRHSALLQTRLAVHHAASSVYLASGDLQAARRELRRALDALEATRQSLGAGDAGTASVMQARSISTLAIHMATLEAHPIRALDWMEQARAASRVARPAIPPTTHESAADFARLRVVAGDLRRAELAGEPTAELRRRHADLERVMRAEWMKAQLPGIAVTARPSLGTLQHAAGEAEIVSIASSSTSLIAVIVDSRQSRMCTLAAPDRVLDLARQTSSTLQGMATATSTTAVAASRQRTFSATLDALDALLLAPLHLSAPHIVLVVPAELHAIPWAAMPSLHGRSFTLAPSVAWWTEAVSSPPASPTSALVVAGPRLAEAQAEADAVAACHRRATVLSGSSASVATVNAALADHDIVHFVAHGHFRHDNPLWSTIELADGQLTVYELERLATVPPTVVLATCDSGVSGTRGGAQLHGLAGTLLTLGARTIVAAIGALPDTLATRQAMVSLHRDLADGVSASASLASQRAHADDASRLTTASLVTLGVG